MTAIQTVEINDQHLLSSLGEGYHQCWYPVALSDDLEPGELRGLEFCDGRIVVYRGEDGDVRAMTPYCKHMGSDLGVGDVVGNELRCAFHHWQYGTDGKCTLIPSGDRIPKSARLSTFPVEERWGIVWVFYGPEPQYPVPTFPTWEDRLTYLAFEIEFREPLLVDPWIFTSNAFDFQHLRVVHGSKIEADASALDIDDHSIKYRMDLDHPHGGSFDLSMHVWGTNCLVTMGEHEGDLSMHVAAGTPMGSLGTRYFMSVAVPKTQGAEELERIKAMHTQLLNEDLPIMNTLRMGKNLFVPADRAMNRYFRYARAYPRASMADFGA